MNYTPRRTSKKWKAKPKDNENNNIEMNILIQDRRVLYSTWITKPRRDKIPTIM